MGMVSDAGNGIVNLFKLLLLLIVNAFCVLGMMYLPLVVLGIDKPDECWKFVLCVSGAIGYFIALSWFGKSMR